MAKYRGKERVSELMEASQCGLTKVPVFQAGEAQGSSVAGRRLHLNNVGQLLPGKEGVQECVGGREITEECPPQESRGVMVA